MKPHKHAELIKAWADGAEIEYRRLESWGMTEWEFISDKTFVWYTGDVHEYRIKPEPKPDVVTYLTFNGFTSQWSEYKNSGFKSGAMKLIWDGETKELKSAEVLK